MAELKKENHIDLFERCAEWLEKNKAVHQSIQWLQTHLEVAVLLVAFLIALVLFALGRSLFSGKSQTAEQPAPVAAAESEQAKTIARLQVTVAQETNARLELARQMDVLQERLTRLAAQIELVAKQPTAPASQVAPEVMRELQTLRTITGQLEAQCISLQKQLDAFRHSAYLGKLPSQADTTPPQGTLTISEEGQKLAWQIETLETGLEILTSVEWEGGVLALKVAGKIGACEIPALCQEATVRTTMRDNAGNETKLTQVWKRKTQK